MIKIEFMICSDQHQLRAEKEAAKARTKLIQQLEDRLNFHIVTVAIDMISMWKWFTSNFWVPHFKSFTMPFILIISGVPLASLGCCRSLLEGKHDDLWRAHGGCRVNHHASGATVDPWGSQWTGGSSWRSLCDPHGQLSRCRDSWGEC